MFSDIITIVGKELKEILNARGNRKGGLIGLLVILGMFGIYMPLMSGPNWIETPISLFYWLWLPFLMVSSTIADAIAGERERHTLETLLASRVSDSAILLGKIAGTLIYGWGLTMAIMFISIAIVNIVFGIPNSTFYIYTPIVLATSIIFSFLIALLSAGIGIIVSLRAETVRQAQQTVSMGFMVIFFSFLLIAQFLPVKLSLLLVEWVQSANWGKLGFLAFVILTIIDTTLLKIARARFQRSKLILD
ncbi:MAG: ABC transporter permease [Anaerolineae bacterium]|jgi:ABC-2 type transport system permease protein|nr:ABC transporter permease [Anaerolineae bacterium]MBT7071473.1 ABC transporter permease [Anaerolineae bacterium]MBT7324828.1 ABC transporter permease [Anaerolineae bacterium]